MFFDNRKHAALYNIMFDKALNLIIQLSLFVQCNIIDDIGIYSDPLITSPCKVDLLMIEEALPFITISTSKLKVKKNKNIKIQDEAGEAELSKVDPTCWITKP
jgi:hypothetical protein